MKILFSQYQGLIGLLSAEGKIKFAMRKVGNITCKFHNASNKRRNIHIICRFIPDVIYCVSLCINEITLFDI